jgi:NIMA (never in mitosis gene a)-related kinase
MKILSGHFPPIPTHYSKNLSHLISSMLQLDPKKRPSIDHILLQPFIQRHIAQYAFLSAIPGALNSDVVDLLPKE